MSDFRYTVFLITLVALASLAVGSYVLMFFRKNPKQYVLNLDDEVDILISAKTAELRKQLESMVDAATLKLLAQKFDEDPALISKLADRARGERAALIEHGVKCINTVIENKQNLLATLLKSNRPTVPRLNHTAEIARLEGLLMQLFAELAGAEQELRNMAAMAND